MHRFSTLSSMVACGYALEMKWARLVFQVHAQNENFIYTQIEKGGKTCYLRETIM